MGGLAHLHSRTCQRDSGSGWYWSTYREWSALAIILPLNQSISAIGIILVSALLVISGHYKKLEVVTSVMAAVMIISIVLTALAVFPSGSVFAKGLVPTIIPDFDPYFVLPWFGFLLAGATGMMWFHLTFLFFLQLF
jgi:hypothetical protein